MKTKYTYICNFKITYKDIEGSFVKELTMTFDINLDEEDFHYEEKQKYVEQELLKKREDIETAKLLAYIFVNKETKFGKKLQL